MTRILPWKKPGSLCSIDSAGKSKGHRRLELRRGETAAGFGDQSSEGYPSYQCLQPLYNLYDRSDYEPSSNRCAGNGDWG